MASLATRSLVEFVERRLRTAADPARAGPMAAYMKFKSPFYGVPKPQRAPMYREMRKSFEPATRAAYEAGVRALWRLEHREEKYAAIAFAGQTPRFITCESIPLYGQLIRQGAWWDVVDEVAIRLVGKVVRAQRTSMRPVLRKWIDDDDLWVRRAALISQILHKTETDEALLFDFCLRRASEPEFFIRKAIGWALRDYSYSAPDRVRRFLRTNRSKLSGLSFREGARGLIRLGLMKV